MAKEINQLIIVLIAMVLLLVWTLPSSAYNTQAIIIENATNNSLVKEAVKETSDNDDFTVEIIPIKPKINVEEQAEFNLTITNKFPTNQEFRIYTLSYPDWDISTRPLLNPILMTVEPLSSKSVVIFVDPMYVTSVGKYKINMNIVSKKTEKAVKSDIEVTIKSTGYLIGGYAPAVTVNVNMPSSIDPRDEIPIKIDLTNQNTIDYPELSLLIESKTINKVLKEKLGPNEEKVIKLTENIDKFTSPKNDVVSILLMMGDRVITGPLVQPIEIVEYTSTEEKSTSGFLKTTKEMIFYSNNENYKGPINVETTRLKSLFTSTYPKARLIKEGGKEYYSFEVSLQNNSMEIRSIENYVPLFVVGILGILALVLYIIYRSPLMIRKSVQNVERREGGISQLKVVLTIKNRSKKPIQSIEVTDKVPNIVDIERELHLGVLQPSKVLKHEKKDSLIKWDVDSLNPGEERVISYRLNSKLPILGDLTLGSAFARFNQGGNVKTSNSNTLSVA